VRGGESLINLYETIFNSVIDGIAIYAPDGKFMKVNQITCDEMGYSEDELLQMNVMDLILPELRAATGISIAEKLKANRCMVETVCKCKDGSFLPIELNIQPIEIDGSHAFLAVARNITERKKAEDAHKKRECEHMQTYNLMQKVIDSPKDVVIFALDKEYRYLSFNKNHHATMEHIWGANIEIGKSMLSYIKYPKDRSKAKINFDRALAGESFMEIEEYGDELLERSWYESVYSPLVDLDGNVVGLTLILSDITKRKKVELALIQAKIIAEESNRTKSQFLATMSHELRTPLNAIIGFSQVLDETIYGDLNAKQAKYVAHVLKSGKHLLELINNILDISRVESGNVELKPVKVDVGATVNEILLLMGPIANKKSIDLEYSINHDDLDMYVDKIKFKQILYNLLNNAIKFTPEKGKVCVNSSINNDFILFSVSDNGIGIPEDSHELIFDSFKQVDSSLNREFEGTGLGLAIVKQYVEMHRGQVWVECNEDGGSNFKFTVPFSCGCE
jgi:PAS domain S-box-containing protein